MNDETKAGYIAGGIFLLIGILITVSGLDAGWSSGGKLTITLGLFLAVLGGGAIWKPTTIGQPLAEYLKKIGEKAEADSIQQHPVNSKNPTQAVAKDHGTVNVQHNYYDTNLPEERTVDEKKELIKEINRELTKEPVSNTLIKCLRLAQIINSNKDISWLENEARGFDDGAQAKASELPDYRVINAEIRIQSTAVTGYTPLQYKLSLGTPIYQIEAWIDSFGKVAPGEMIIRAPLSNAFKKAFRESLKRDPPEEDVPYIIPIGELKKVLNGLKLRITKFVSSIK